MQVSTTGAQRYFAVDVAPLSFLGFGIGHEPTLLDVFDINVPPLASVGALDVVAGRAAFAFIARAVAVAAFLLVGFQLFAALSIFSNLIN